MDDNIKIEHSNNNNNNNNNNNEIVQVNSNIKSVIEIPEGLKVDPYEYQIESYRHCVATNTILVLSTGMGKTLISIMTLLELKRMEEAKKGSKKVAVFLVDRIPLVVQQSEAILSAFDDLKVVQFYSEINDAQKRKNIIDMEFDVLVATAQSLVNLLKSNLFKMQHVYFLVFDEVHHANGEHAFNEVMRYVQLLSFTQRPRILGLTASVCSEDTVKKNIEKIKLIEHKMSSKVFRPQILLSEPQSQMNTEIIQFEYYAQEESFCSQLQSIIKDLVKQFIDKLDDTHQSDLDLDDISNYAKYKNALSKLQTKFGNSQYLQIISAITKMYDVIYIIKVEGTKKGLSELELALKHSNLLPKVMKQIYKVLCITRSDDPIVKEYSSRYTKFTEILSKNLQEFKDEHSDNLFRGIVFVEQRYSADRLYALLSNNKDFANLNPKQFVGHGGINGMTTHEQQTVINLFKSGETKLLVATNILEEGLDIKDCNLVICYDGISNLMSLIQKRGRARSNLNSKFYILATKEKSKEVEKVINKETTMVLAIAKLVKEREQKSTDNNLITNMRDFNYQTISEISYDISKVFFISFFHINLERFEEELELLFYGLVDYRLLMVKRVLIPSNEEFMQYSHFVAIEYQGNKFFDYHRMLQEVLDKLMAIGWWAKIPTHLDNSIDKKILDNDAINSTPVIEVNETNGTPTPDGQIPNNSFFSQHSNIVKKRNPIIDINLLALDFGNLKHPVEFSMSKSLNITHTKPARFYLFKREFQFHHEDRIYSYMITDLLPYCVIIHTTEKQTTTIPTGNEKIFFQFYLFLNRPGKIVRKTSPTKESTIKSHPPLDLKECFGKSFTYRFTFYLKRDEIENLKSKLSRHGFELFYGNIITSNTPNHLNYDEIKHTDVQYLFECLKTNHSFGKPCYTQDFINQIAAMVNAKQQESALFILREALQNKILFYDLSKLIADYKDRLELIVSSALSNKKDKEHNNQKEVKFVIMTPSRTIYQPPSLIKTNRVIRRFDHKRFMLFHFQDERLQKLAYLGPDLKSLVENVIVKNGITVNGLTYKFLGGSQSQMKNIGCWLYNDHDTTYTTHSIRDWMGSIPRFPRKFLRSMGILFSSTTPALPIANNEFIEIKEPENRSQFTEGCGTIGSDMVERINKNHGYPPKTCSYQIRFGGYKGVLSIDPNPDHKNLIRLRSSMKKFDTPNETAHRTLEIISISTAKTCHLSRPLITLLSGIGVPDSYFTNLFHNTLTQFTKPLINIEEAKKQLNTHFPGVTSYDLLTDNFLRRIQILYYKKQLGDLQQKFNMEISLSRNLLGIADETNTLAPNTVFIQITERIKDDHVRRVITGKVCLTRNPTAHPGDIRFLTAVNSPALENHYNDVIVFSVKGDIPNFKESSGGDLDGDRYFVFFDPELIAHCKQHSPSGFEDLKSPDEPEDKDILGNDTLGKQFCFNLQRSYIGDIANDYLAICDKLGVTHNYSLQLSKEHFKEVDVVKHGEHAIIPAPIKKYLQSRGYPHFMKKSHDSNKLYYKSEKVLGVMYDQCRQLDFIGDIIPAIKLDLDLIIPGHETYEKDAKEKYLIYKYTIHNVMKRHNAKTEEELTLGFFENPETNFIHTNDSKENAHTQFKRIREEYHTLFLNEFFTESDDVTLAKHADEIEKKISAWYKVAYSDVEDNRTLSFYWNIKHLQKKNDNTIEIEKYSLSRSVYDHFLNHMVGVEHTYAQRLEILQLLNEQIKKSKNLPPGSTLDLIGSTCLLLFEENSNLNLVYTFNDENNPSPNLKLGYLERLSAELESLPFISEKSYDNDESPSLKYTIKSIQVTICIDSEKYKSYKSAISHIENNPFLLPFLVLITKWTKACYLVESEEFQIEKLYQKNRNKKSRANYDNIKYLSLPAVVLEIIIPYCISQKLIPNEIIELSIDENIRNDKPWSYWNHIITISVGPDRTSIAEKILDFLNYHNKYFLNKLSPPNNLTTEEKRPIKFYQETFLVGYHSLSHSKNIEQFFNSCTVIKRNSFEIKDKNIVTNAKIDELKLKLGHLLHFKYIFQPNTLKPKNILYEGDSRSLYEAGHIIRSVLFQTK